MQQLEEDPIIHSISQRAIYLCHDLENIFNCPSQLLYSELGILLLLNMDDASSALRSLEERD